MKLKRASLRIAGLLSIFAVPAISSASPVLVDSLVIPSTEASPMYSAASVSAGTRYRLEASGTYAWGGGSPYLGDAGYLTNDAWSSIRTDVGIRATTLPSPNFAAVPGVGAGSLLVDFGTGPEVVDWGDYTSSHAYEFEFTATSSLLGFVIGDWWGNWDGGECQFQGCLFDNAGSLSVTVSEISSVPNPPTVANVVHFPDFSDVSSLNLNGDAVATANTSGDSVLRLADSASAGFAQSGSAFLDDTFLLGIDGAFSTTFDFQISQPSGLADTDGIGADGVAFVLQSRTSDFNGLYGGYLGYAAFPTLTSVLPLTNSFAVEFDTFFNDPGTYPNISDSDGNHVGININGSVVSIATAAVLNRMNDGDIWRAWIDYSGLSQILEVRLSDSDVRPDDPLLAFGIDLMSILRTNEVFAGFTGGAAGGAGDHDILAWSLSSESNSVPTPAPIWLYAATLTMLGYCAKRKATS